MTRRPRVAALLRLLQLIAALINQPDQETTMSTYSGTPCRRCAPCDRDWPNVATYNLCPRCQKCTFASTTENAPDYPKAKEDAARYKAIRDFDAEADATALERDPWVAEWEATLLLDIPEPLA